MKAPSLGIAWKLIGSIVGSLVLLFGLMIYFIYTHHKSHLESAVINSAMNINETIKRTIIHDMLRSNCSQAFELIHTIAKNDGIEKIRIFSSTGRIEHTTLEAELHTFLDTDAEQCMGCHAGPVPQEQPDSGHQNWRIFTNAGGQRTLGVTNPIWNEASCSTADCHYHSPELSVLGVLDVNMSLENVDKHVASDRNLTIVFFLIAAAVIAFISGTFILVMVHKPVKQLIEGMQTISSGKLDHKLDIRRGDEIGQLALTFNSMTTELKRAQDQVKGWAKTLEERIEEKTEELERAHRQILRVEKMASLGKLSAIVAHEINNPLTGVLTYARLLQKKIDRKKKEIEEGAPADFSDCVTYLHVIESETARCGDIVRNLLMFSKKNTVNLEKNDFNDLLRKSIKLVHHQLELSEVELVEELADDLPVITCDAGQIQQIFVALLVNAVEAIGKGGTIKVASRFDELREQIVFECKDDGPGMEDEVRRKIFEPFFTTKEGTNGSGLGLAVVYGIVERHGGRIKVESSPGNGAKFIIRLPLEPPQRPDSFDEIPYNSQPDRL